MKTKSISIDDTHEMVMSTFRMRPDSILICDISSDADHDFLNLISTGHAGCGVSPTCVTSQEFRRLNIILTGKNRKGKTTKFKRGRKYGR